MPLVKAALPGLIALALLAAVPAQAGMGAPEVPIKVAKHADGPFQSGSFMVNVKSKPRSFYFKIINRDDHDLDVTLDDVSHGDGLADFGVRWFRGNRDITQEVRATGHAFGLKQSKARVFQGRVKPKVGNPGEICLAPRFHVEPDSYDAVHGIYINDTGVCG